MKKVGAVINFNLNNIVHFLLILLILNISINLVLADDVIGECPEGCMCYSQDSNYCAGTFYFPGGGEQCLQNLQGDKCADGYICSQGECVEAGSSTPCPYGLTSQACTCGDEIITAGKYCCDYGASLEQCNDKYYLHYKWYPSEETTDPEYCGENSIDCPQPNPFMWNNALTNNINFLSQSDYDAFFEVIPLFNNYYFFGEYWPNLYNYLTQETTPPISDSLADYPMYIQAYEKLSTYNKFDESPNVIFTYDYHFCTQEDGLIGTVPDSKISDAGGTKNGDSLEVYCRNNVVRLCLSNEPCPWRTDITSADDKTCQKPAKYGDEYQEPSFAWGINDNSINIPEIAQSGTGAFKQVWCTSDYQGYTSGWYGHEEPFPEFELNPGYYSEDFVIYNEDVYQLDSTPTIVFPDPDDSSGTYCENSQGYKLGYSQITRYWDPATEECAGDDFISDEYYGEDPEEVPTEGSEDYRPDFIYQTVDESDFSQGFCLNSEIGINIGNRAWNDEAKCCGDDNGQIYPDFKLDGTTASPSPEELLNGLNNYADCAKLVNGNYLCNMQTDATSSWESAQDKEGDIVHISCYQPGTELVSNNETWFACGEILEDPNQYSHQFTGEIFTNEIRMSFADETKHSYFCKPTQTGLESIYECCMGENCKSDTDAGLRYKTGESFYLTEENQMYYCTINTDKDNNEIISGPEIESTLWTNDLDLTNSQSCENSYTDYTWTGAEPYHDSENNQNFCCGEYDDSREAKNGDDVLLLESYNDNGGSGICFNATFQLNNNPITLNEITYDETLIVNGNLLGCGVDEDNSISTIQCSGEQGSCNPGTSYRTNKYKDNSKPFKDNNWMLDLEDWPNPGQEDSTQESLVLNQNYCTIVGANGNDYYCDYDETWKQTTENKSHLSFVEWETTNQKAGCCLPTQCWNGTECIDSQADNPMLLPYGTEEEPYRCINGEWKFSELKYTWDREQSGYCQDSNQCLVNPSGIQGDPENPQCINSDTFIGDHYCEDGEWTTRTKFLALQLLEIAPKNQPYTLYCDYYQNTLNQYNYNDIESYILYPRQLNGTQFDSVNNFCILRYGADDKVVIATSLNHPISTSDVNFLNVFNQNIQGCPEGSGFMQCASSPEYLYYNRELNSIIYSKTELSLGDTPTNILTFFQAIFDFVIENFSPTISGTFNFIAETNNFNQIYTSNEEQVVAVREQIYPTQEHISLRYWGIGADVCETIEVYDNKLGAQDFIQCQEDSGKYYISSNLQEGVNVWYLLTSKLRPEKVQ